MFGPSARERVSTMQQDLRHRLLNLRRAVNADWTEETRGGAPHKPILLLAVMDLVESGLIVENLVPYDDRLLSVFDDYWAACRGERLTNPLQPFWHLKNDGVWSLVPRGGQAQAELDAMGGMPSLRRFREVVAGGRLAADLWTAASSKEGRQEVRQLLLGCYFGEALRNDLAVRHGLVVEAVVYESVLRKRLEQDLRDLFAGDGALGHGYTDEGRTMAFRSVIVAAYEHSCAVCEARIRTPSGRSVVHAAHIVPFHVCHNNDPRNGLALCPLHHWAFDEGMLTIGSSFEVRIHASADEFPADEGFRALHGRSLRLPQDRKMHPASVAIEWHRKNVFEKVR